jgi:hypothetical protein
MKAMNDSLRVQCIGSIHTTYHLTLSLNQQSNKLQANDLGFIPARGKRFPSTPQHPDQLMPTQPPMQWVLGALSQGVKWLGHEPDHSPPPSPNVKNGGAIPPLPICLHGMVLYLSIGTPSALLLWTEYFHCVEKNTVNMDKNIQNICQVICIPASHLTGQV